MHPEKHQNIARLAFLSEPTPATRAPRAKPGPYDAIVQKAYETGQMITLPVLDVSEVSEVVNAVRRSATYVGKHVLNKDIRTTIHKTKLTPGMMHAAPVEVTVMVHDPLRKGRAAGRD